MAPDLGQGPYLAICLTCLLLMMVNAALVVDKNTLKLVLKSFYFWFLATNITIRAMSDYVAFLSSGNGLSVGYTDAYLCMGSPVYFVGFLLYLCIDAWMFSLFVKRALAFIAVTNTVRSLFTVIFTGRSPNPVQICFLFCTDTKSLTSSCDIPLLIFGIKIMYFIFRYPGHYVLLRSSIKRQVLNLD